MAKINFLTIVFLLVLSPMVLSNFWAKLKDKVSDITVTSVAEHQQHIVSAIEGNEELKKIRQTGILEPISNTILQSIPTVISPTISPQNSPAVRTTTTPETTTSDCIPSITVAKGKETCKDDLIFEDNFENLNTEIWKRDTRFSSIADDGEFVLYHPENCNVQDGILQAIPKLLTEFPGFNEERLRSGQLNLGSYCTGTNQSECFRRAGGLVILPPVVACKLNTKASFSFKYGKIEIRAKFPKGDWIFPQLYLEPLQNTYGSSGYASGQMRIGFIRGNEMLESDQNEQIDGYRMSGGFVLSPKQNLRDKWMKSILFEKHVGDDFHKYTLTWTDQYISVAMDGITYANYRSSSFRQQAQANNIPYTTEWNEGEAMAPFDQEFYLSFGLAAGGMSDFPDLSMNGVLGSLKPWNNTSPDAELNFWLNKDNWYPSWRDQDAALQIDYVKVWAV